MQAASLGLLNDLIIVRSLDWFGSQNTSKSETLFYVFSSIHNYIYATRFLTEKKTFIVQHNLLVKFAKIDIF